MTTHAPTVTEGDLGWSSEHATTPDDQATRHTHEAIEQYGDMVYAICVTHTRSRSDADDAFQDVFLTYHRKQPVCESEGRRQGWLIRTAMNISRRVTESSWRTRVVPVGTEHEAWTRAETFHFEDPRHDRLLAALAGLSETYRSVIHLFYIEDMPVARIAEVLGVEPGTIKMRLSRARSMLRAAMTKEES